MKKRRARRAASGFSPFTFYADMMKAGLQAGSLMSASAEVIARRGEMMQKAMAGELPGDHAEFTRMWQEKMVAGGAFMAEAFAQWSKAGGIGAFPFLPKAPLGSALPNWMALMAPYEKKAAANARRLRKAKR